MDGEIFTCELENELGCKSQVKTVIEKTMINANFMFGVSDPYNPIPSYQNWYDTCSRTATFIDLSQVHGGSKKKRITWEIVGLPVVSHDSLFTYTFPDRDTIVTYLVRLTVEAENGCADTSKSMGNYITIYPSARVMINGTTQLCEGKEAHLLTSTIRSQFTEHNWKWRKRDGSTGSHKGDTLLINGQGTYCLQSLDTNGCYAYDTLIITPLKPVIPNLQITHVDCYGNATGSFSHGGFVVEIPFREARWTIWDDISKIFVDSSVLDKYGQPIDFRNQIAGKYVFYGLDADSCLITDTIVISEPNPLSFSAITKTATCLADNGKIAFEVAGGLLPYNISIIGSGKSVHTNKATDTIIYLPADVYIVTIVDKNNCVLTDTLTVNQIIPLSSVSLSKKNITMGINQDTVLFAILSPSNACNKEVVWHSKDTSIVIVNESGSLRSLSYGTTYVVVTSEEGGFQDSCKIIVSDVGIAETHCNVSLRIYPNPTNGELKISLPKPSEGRAYEAENVEIYNVMGQVVLSTEALRSLMTLESIETNETTIDVSGLSKGMYFLKIGNQVLRFLKE